MQAKKQDIYTRINKIELCLYTALKSETFNMFTFYTREPKHALSQLLP